MTKIFDHLLSETSQSLNMTRQHLKLDMKRLAQRWEIVLEKGHVEDVNTAMLFLDTGVHGYLKAKGIDLEKRTTPKSHHAVLAAMMLLIPIYVLSQSEFDFPKIHELTSIEEQPFLPGSRPGDVLDQAEKILRQKRENKS